MIGAVVESLCPNGHQRQMSDGGCMWVALDTKIYLGQSQVRGIMNAEQAEKVIKKTLSSSHINCRITPK